MHIDIYIPEHQVVNMRVFQLTWETIDSPITDLEAALDTKGLSRETFWVLEPGSSKGTRPARSAMGADGLALDASLELECIAARP